MTITHYLLAIPALAVVLALAMASAWLARRLGLNRAAPAAGRHVRVIEQMALDGRRRLHLIECDGQRVLLATGGAADVVLGTWRSRGEGS